MFKLVDLIFLYCEKVVVKFIKMHRLKIHGEFRPLNPERPPVSYHLIQNTISFFNPAF